MEWRIIVWLIVIGLIVGWLFNSFVQENKATIATNLVGATVASVIGGGIFYALDLGAELLLGGITALLVIFIVHVFKMGD